MIDLRLGDCLEILPTIPDESIDLVFVDPPYNIGKAAWDRIDGYLEWCDEWIAECSRVLKPNGAFWVSHSKPLVLAQLSTMVAQRGRGLVNWITWWKHSGEQELGRANALKGTDGLRSWFPAEEFLVYHADEGAWTSQCDRERGFIFEPLRAYLAEERELSSKPFGWFDRRIGTNGLSKKDFNHAQWQLPTESTYTIYQTTGRFCRDYEDLRTEFEITRTEFESLRYTFNNPGKMSSVWQIPPAKANGHETPKPEELLRRIILATSNEGDTVLDPMMGSGTTGVVCREFRRKFVGIEKEPKYYEMAKERIETAQLELL